MKSPVYRKPAVPQVDGIRNHFKAWPNTSGTSEIEKAKMCDIAHLKRIKIRWSRIKPDLDIPSKVVLGGDDTSERRP